MKKDPTIGDDSLPGAKEYSPDNERVRILSPFWSYAFSAVGWFLAGALFATFI